MHKFYRQVKKLDSSSFFKEKLATLLFVEIDRKKVHEIFHIDIHENEQLFVPMRPQSLAGNIIDKNNSSSIPVSVFIEGMFYELGGDQNFKYSSVYKQILNNINQSIPYIKGIIYNDVVSKKYEDAYIFLKGLLCIEESKENYSMLLKLGEKVRDTHSFFKDEELDIIEKAKKISKYPDPYLYEALIKKDDKDFEGALFCINTYLQNCGEETQEVTQLKVSLKNVVNYERGKELTYTEPDTALKYLIPLLDEFGDNPSLYYYIAVSYRILNNYEKAIYYLNEALSIDNSFVDVVNEIGINYACLGNYKTAVSYFRKVFEATHSVSICTNLIMCYLNMGDIDMAKKHMDIAEKLAPDDKVVLKLKKMLK